MWVGSFDASDEYKKDFWDLWRQTKYDEDQSSPLLELHGEVGTGCLSYVLLS